MEYSLWIALLLLPVLVHSQSGREWADNGELPFLLKSYFNYLEEFIYILCNVCVQKNSAGASLTVISHSIPKCI